MVPLGLFRSPVFAGTNAMTLLLYAALGALLFYFPFNLIQVQHYTPTEAGAAMLPFVALLTALSGWAGGLVDRHGARLPLVLGPTITAVGFGLFALPGTGGSYWTTFFPAMTVLGFGMSLTVAPLTTVVMGAVSQEQSGTASGINNAVSRVGSLLAIAVLGLVVLGTFSSALDERLAKLDLPLAARLAIDAQRTRLGETEPPADLPEAKQAEVKRAVAESYVASFRVLSWLAAGLALASAASAAALVGKKRQQSG